MASVRASKGAIGLTFEQRKRENTISFSFHIYDERQSKPNHRIWLRRDAIKSASNFSLQSQRDKSRQIKKINSLDERLLRFSCSQFGFLSNKQQIRGKIHDLRDKIAHFEKSSLHFLALIFHSVWVVDRINITDIVWNRHINLRRLQ